MKTSGIISTSMTDSTDSSLLLPLKIKRNKDSLKPFVHPFQTDVNKYIFDVNTGRILAVDSIIWHIICDFDLFNRKQLICKYSPHYTTSEVCSAYDKISHSQQYNKLFLPKYPKEITLPSLKLVKDSIRDGSRFLTLHVTESCNLKCQYCIYEDRRGTWGTRSGRMMKWNVAKRALDEHLKFNDYHSTKAATKTIGFYGGEPLLNFKLIKRCVEYALQKRGHNIIFKITTNGLLLTGTIANFLTSAKFFITISLDGPAHIHDRYRIQRNGSKTWNTVISNFRRFVIDHPEYKSNGRLGINCVISPATNPCEVEEFFSSCDLFQGISTSIVRATPTDSTLFDSLPNEHYLVSGTNSLYRNFLQNLASGAINKDPENKAWCVQRALHEKTFGSIHNRPIAKLGQTLIAPVGPRDICIPGISIPQVSVDGGYYPCDNLPLTKDLKLGDVWKGKNASKIHDIIVEMYTANKDECASCWCTYLCEAGCYRDFIADCSFSTEVKREKCRQYRNVMHNGLVDYCKILEQNSQAFDYLKSD